MENFDLEREIEEGLARSKAGLKRQRIRTWAVGIFLIFIVLIAGFTLGTKPVLIAPISTETVTATVTGTETFTPSPMLHTLTSTPSLTPTPTYTPTATPYPNEITDSFGVDMVLIPEGNFIMGGDIDHLLAICRQQDFSFSKNLDASYFCQRSAFADVDPIHTVYLEDFYIDKYEVTVAMYKECMDASVCLPPTSGETRNKEKILIDPEFENYPMINVDWTMARDFCSWRGVRLPTEAEWEKTARGTNGTIVYAGWSDWQPVGLNEIENNPYGVKGMYSNVSEWVSSLYKPYPYQIDDGRENQSAKGDRIYRDATIYGTVVRIKSMPQYADYHIGFRCAKYVDR